MNNKVFVSCVVTGSGDTASKHPDLPKTPEQIAKSAIEGKKWSCNSTYSCKGRQYLSRKIRII